ncbi:MAG: hypothetical protein OSB21_00430 [Myxococcota bacterium]|nr:hypothetical protein [Myxococcota bacterium]
MKMFWFTVLLASSALAQEEDFGLEDSDPGEELGLEEAQAPAAPVYRRSTLLKGNMDMGVSVDTRHQRAQLGAPEDFFEAWRGLRLHLTHKTAPGRTWRVGARLRMWGSMDHPNEGGEIKSLLQTEITEMRYDYSLGQRLVLQLGLQKVDWSVTDGMGPSVMFAPRDLRFGPVGNPDDSSLPVEAVTARYTLSFRRDAHLELAFVPLHRPAELRLWGNDWGMVRPGQGGALPLGDIAWLIDPSVEEFWQNNLMYFTRPELKPADLSGALRLRGRYKGAELGIWGFYGFDTLPELRMDEDLIRVIGMVTTMGDAPLLETMTPETIATLERFQGKMMQARASGDPSILISSVFHRLAQIGAQARRSFGSVVVALESAWTPKFLGGRVLFDPAMKPLPGLATLHTALQVEYQSPPGLIAVLGISDFWVADVPKQPLMILDAGLTARDGSLERPFAASSAHLISVNLMTKMRFKERFDVLLLGVVHPFAGDWLAMPSLAWLLDGERSKVAVSAEIFGGPEDSLFGMFSHNDRVTLNYKQVY